ncbi:MAG: hypothetical protein AMXMBFR34_42610 [Myxococcaceae bacterium]
MSRASGFDARVTERLAKLRPGQRYAVLRLWLNKDVREDLPVFVITDRVRVLDAVTVFHRFEEETKAGGGFVLELHCYAVPEAMPDEQVRTAFLEELVRFFPELAGFRVHHEVFQLKRDFTAFHVGLDAERPTVETGMPGFACAGDWVKLPSPPCCSSARARAGCGPPTSSCAKKGCAKSRCCPFRCAASWRECLRRPRGRSFLSRAPGDVPD